MAMTVTPLRTKWTIGGSECAAAAGVHPYVSRVQLWAEKTGRMARPETEAMRWGTVLEAAVLDAVPYDVQPEHTLPDPYDQTPEWVRGTPDGWVAEPRAIIEAKTIGQWAHREGVAPVQYDAQCQWYMHVYGFDRAILAMLVGGQRLELIELERNQPAIDALLELAEEFVGFLRRDKPPPPDGSSSAKSALLAIYPGVEGQVVRLTKAHMESLRELRERKAQLDAVKAQVTELENTLKAAMGDADTAISPHDAEVIRWRKTTSRRIDTTTLKAQRPELAELFTTEAETRRFTLV